MLAVWSWCECVSRMVEGSTPANSTASMLFSTSSGAVDEGGHAGGLVDHDVDVVAESGGSRPHDAEIAIDQLLHGVIPLSSVSRQGYARAGLSGARRAPDFHW